MDSTRRGFLAGAFGASLAGLSGFHLEGATDVPFADPPPGRPARIATTTQDGKVRRSIAENREYVMSLLDRAIAQKPDLVCLPETFPTSGNGGLPVREKAETVPGPTIDMAARRARDARCYVVCPLETVRDGIFYNSAVILDRSGQIVGIYDKACPVTMSHDYTTVEGGIRPGPADIPVFDLDFGRIAVQICFDVGFPENWDLIRRKGARLVFWPSAYDGGFPLWAYAYIHHFYVVSSVRSGQSRIIDPCGAIMKETQKDVPVVWRDLNLDFVVSHLDWNYSIPEKIKQKYGEKVDVRRTNMGSSHFVVEPVDGSITTRQLQDEFGFESTFQYHDRHRRAYQQLRKGEPAPPQQARHGQRPQWGKF